MLTIEIKHTSFKGIYYDYYTSEYEMSYYFTMDIELNLYKLSHNTGTELFDDGKVTRIVSFIKSLNKDNACSLQFDVSNDSKD